MKKMGATTMETSEPYEVNLVSGRTYYWCACGLSRKQPFCDGSHKGSGIEPLAFVASEAGPAAVCGCKRSREKPYCDGSHETL